MVTGPIAKSVSKGILKGIGTRGRKTIGGVKVKKIPKGKRSKSPKEMQRIVKEEPYKGKLQPGWHAERGFATKGLRRKLGETGVGGSTAIKSKSKKEIAGLRGQRKSAEQKKAKELKDLISKANQKLKILEDDLHDSKGHKMFKEPSNRNITKLKEQIKKVKKAIREAQRDLKKRPKVRKDGGQVVKKYAKGKQIAAVPDWMKGLSDEEIGEILGSPPTQPGGVKRHTKRKKKKPHKKKVSIKTAKAGGQMSDVGLSPAEESRSGTMSEAKRKKYQRGGPIHHNTSRENRLEELGRVDAEKAYTPQGRRNLKDEKKRIVRGLKKGGQVTNGNDFVAQHYDS